MLVLCFRPAGVILPQHYGGRELLPGQLLPPWIRGVAGAGALVSSFDVLEHLCTCVPVALLEMASTLASFQHRCTCLLSHSLKWCRHSLSVSIHAHVVCGAPYLCATQVCPAGSFCPTPGMKLRCPDGHACPDGAWQASPPGMLVTDALMTCTRALPCTAPAGSIGPVKCNVFSRCVCEHGCKSPNNFAPIPVRGCTCLALGISP